MFSPVTCHVPLSSCVCDWNWIWCELQTPKDESSNPWIPSTQTDQTDKKAATVLCLGLANAPVEINYLTLQLVKRRDNVAGGNDLASNRPKKYTAQTEIGWNWNWAGVATLLDKHNQHSFLGKDLASSCNCLTAACQFWQLRWERVFGLSFFQIDFRDGVVLRWLV